MQEVMLLTWNVAWKLQREKLGMIIKTVGKLTCALCQETYRKVLNMIKYISGNKGNEQGGFRKVRRYVDQTFTLKNYS